MNDRALFGLVMGIVWCGALLGMWLLEVVVPRYLSNRRLSRNRDHERRQLVAESSAIAEYMREPRWFRSETRPPRPPPTSMPSSGAKVRR